MDSIVNPVDFERVLKTASAARSPHFAIHHMNVSPAPRRPKLSTGASSESKLLVDGSPPTGLWLGLVVPKRHAKRSVTRSLLKRQIRAAVQRSTGSDHGMQGMWVVRLRSPFDRSAYPSAASDALAAAARSELDGLMALAMQRAGQHSRAAALPAAVIASPALPASAD